MSWFTQYVRHPAVNALAALKADPAVQSNPGALQAVLQAQSTATTLAAAVTATAHTVQASAQASVTPVVADLEAGLQSAVDGYLAGLGAPGVLAMPVANVLLALGEDRAHRYLGALFSHAHAAHAAVGNHQVPSGDEPGRGDGPAEVLGLATREGGVRLMTLDVQLMEAASGLAAVAAGFTGWLWRTHHTADKALECVRDLKADHEADRVAYGKRLEQAEQKADAVGGLGEAIKHMTEVFTLEIKGINEKQDIRNAYTNEQLADIKHEQKTMRLKVDTLSVAPRGRGGGEGR